MKKFKIVFILVGVIISLFCNSLVYASYNSFDLNLFTTSNTFMPGSIVNLSLVLSNINVNDGQGGIAGYTASISYDKNVFDFIEATKGNDEKWNFSCSDTGEIVAYREDTIALNNTDIVESGISGIIKLKVKDDASAGKTRIALENVVGADIDSDAMNTILGNTNALEINIEEKSASLKNIEVTSMPTKTTYKEGEKFEPKGMEVLANYEDGTSTQITNYTYSQNSELKTSDKNIKITYTENGVTKETLLNITVKAKDNTNIQDNNLINIVANDTKENVNIGNESNDIIIDNSDEDNNEVIVNMQEAKDDESSSKAALPKTGKTKIITLVVIFIVISGGSIVGYRKYKGI